MRRDHTAVVLSVEGDTARVKCPLCGRVHRTRYDARDRWRAAPCCPSGGFWLPEPPKSEPPPRPPPGACQSCGAVDVELAMGRCETCWRGGMLFSAMGEGLYGP